ncbi:hypothetical protein Sjap_008666 [Stephania japonica]|uniref:Reverse transcriptase n=1 Tax=Stephania japonica TaxID=461633 RepID=A0AAP0JQ32_9MAGN
MVNVEGLHLYPYYPEPWQFLHMKILLSQTNYFLFTTLYGSPRSWEDLVDIALSSFDPWLIMGDFNALLCINDKLGGSRPVKTCKAFSCWVKYASLLKGLQKLEKKLKEELERVLTQEELLWQQKANFEWNFLGDHNIAFFHARVNTRKKNRTIHSVRLPNGTSCSDQSILLTEVASFFKHIYTGRDAFPFTNLLVQALAPVHPAHAHCVQLCLTVDRASLLFDCEHQSHLPASILRPNVLLVLHSE